MKVLELWRYPVKSLLGERLDSVAVTADGLVGDRQFALFDVETGLGLTARRVPQLLFASARWRDDGTVEIVLPDGSTARDDEALSTWIGREVTLQHAGRDGARRYENPDDIEAAAPNWSTFTGASGAFHDASAARVSLVTSATLGTWNGRRFRTNVYLDGEGEDEAVGHRATLGTAVLDVGMHISRCVMITRPQAGGVERDLPLLRTIATERGGRLSVGATVVHPGTVAVGDAFTPDR
jgi:uncharacterized protein YcbX